MIHRFMDSTWQHSRPPLGIACLLLVAGLLPMPAAATTHLFRIDPAATTLSLQGTTGTGIWQEQGPGSLSATFQGWLVVDLEASSLQIVSTEFSTNPPAVISASDPAAFFRVGGP